MGTRRPTKRHPEALASMAGVLNVLTMLGRYALMGRRGRASFTCQARSTPRSQTH